MSNDFDLHPVFPKNKGIFIAVEGMDGAGKTTAVSYLQYLIDLRFKEQSFENNRQGSNFSYRTREPGGTPFAEEVRKLFLSEVGSDLSAETSTLLMAALRHDHCEKVINPIVEMGGIVICDRYSTSTEVYQHKAGLPYIHQVMAAANGDGKIRKPDYTLHFHLDVNTAIARLDTRHKRNNFDDLSLHEFEPRNHFDDATIHEFQRRSKDYYDAINIRDLEQGKAVLINANHDLPGVMLQLKAFIQNVFP